MNLFNRLLSLISLENKIKVVLKDHGFVRDCCAEYGIFTDVIPFSKNSVCAKKEYHLNKLK